MGNTAYGNWHPGFAWAANKYAINALGGLLDSPAILGAADHHMALALIGKANRSYPADIHPNYKKQVLAWEARATEHIKKDVGFVPGTIIHNWHGKKKDRKYTERWEIYRIPPIYDPELDIKKDWQGVFQLTDRNIKLRDAIR